MPKTLEFEFRTDGSVVGIYDDMVPDLANELGSIDEVDRASTVEWEDAEKRKGWVVRAACRPEVRLVELRNNDGEALFLVTASDKFQTAYFKTREQALDEEVKHFWSLLIGQDEMGV